MTTITIPKEKLSRVLLDVEMLIKDVSSLLNQEEIAKERIADIEEDPSMGLNEEELDNYLKKRGIKIGRMDN